MRGSTSDELWIRRCFDLASRGIGYVSPNPPVGAVLVHEGRIIGEGFHTGFGNPHAEVETLRSVATADRHLIPASILYVSLEPCCITAKTPPCTSLLIDEGIRDVRVSITDPNPEIAGKGIALLNAHGIRTTTGILEKEGRHLIRSFTTNMSANRPHVVMKWAQSKFGYVGSPDTRVLISEKATQLFSHRLRHESDVILVGARTVSIDDPSLTVREYPGRSPHRAVYDPVGRLDSHYRIFNDDGRSILYFSVKPNESLAQSHITYIPLRDDASHLTQILAALYDKKAGNLLVEGGPYLQSLFIADNLWDEAWVIQARHELNTGIKAPVVRGELMAKMKSGTDTLVGIRQKKGN